MDWIEKLARKHGTGGWQTLDDIVRFGKAVAAAERERIAVEWDCCFHDEPGGLVDIGAAIRGERSN